MKSNMSKLCVLGLAVLIITSRLVSTSSAQNTVKPAPAKAAPVKGVPLVTPKTTAPLALQKKPVSAAMRRYYGYYAKIMGRPLTHDESHKLFMARQVYRQSIAKALGLTTKEVTARGAKLKQTQGDDMAPPTKANGTLDVPAEKVPAVAAH